MQTEDTGKGMYLELLKETLSFSLWPEPPVPIERYNYLRSPMKRKLIGWVVKALAKRRLHLSVEPRFTEEDRRAGKIWPGYAETMVGRKRLDNVQECVETVIAENIPGDLIETGSWRGGVCILMRAVLKAHGITDRRVFVADSFEGLPPPDLKLYPQDAGDDHHRHEIFKVTQKEVERNFARYGLLDSQVVFLPGFFHQTLPKAPIERLSVLRLDGDMYGSTWEALSLLYPKLSPGGFCIIDDYALKGCKAAVHEYRKEQNIEAPLLTIDWTGRYWRKP